MLDANGTAIRRVRIVQNGIERLAAQQRVAHVLAQMEFHPSGLAPGAVLCLRQLRDPKPGALSLARIGARPPPAWEQAVHAALDQSVARAARPAHASAPRDAEAVLFADRAELVACLARDWLRGEVHAHWWWQSLFRLDDLPRLVLAEWLRAPEHIPPAMEQLAATGDADAFVSMLDEPAARVFLQSVTRRFGLGALASVLETCPAYALASRAPDVFPFSREPRAPPVAFASTPFHDWAPETEAPALAILHRVLLGVTLLLERAPTIVRAPGFAVRVSEWLSRSTDDARSSPRAQGGATTSGTNVLAPFVPPVSPLPAPQQEHARPPASVKLPSTSLGYTPIILKFESESPALTDRVDSAHPETSKADDVSVVLPTTVPSTASVQAREPTDVPSVTVERTTPKALALNTVINTAYGGVFYLLNLALYLELYGDFSTPLEPGLALSPWDFLALVGRELNGENFLDDPLWALLAQLAGRELDTPPGIDFVASNEWQIPPKWLTPFREQTDWTYILRKNRVRVLHPAGFVVLDVERTRERAQAQLLRELRTYNVTRLPTRGAPLAASSSVVRPSSPSALWLSWLMPYLRARLQRALGTGDSDELARMLCEHPARVRTSATHLDIVLSLAELPVAIRFAGLDRDPGWIPAAGKSVAFQFT